MTRRNNSTQGFKVNSRRNVYEMIFARLQQLGAIDENGQIENGYMRFTAPGFMDLIIEQLDKDIILVGHYGKQNGDLMADPEMEIRVYPGSKMCEALTFTNHYVGLNQVVYPEPGKFYPKLKKELNAFLNSWLKRVIEDQGFKLAGPAQGA